MLRSEAKLQTCKTRGGEANRVVIEPWPSGGITVTTALAQPHFERKNLLDQVNPAASIPRSSFFRSAISSRNRAASSNCRSRAAAII